MERVGTTKFHLMRVVEGEQLPKGYSRSYARLLLQKSRCKVKVNQSKVIVRMAMLESCAAIVNFVDPKLNP